MASSLHLNRPLVVSVGGSKSSNSNSSVMLLSFGCRSSNTSDPSLFWPRSLCPSNLPASFANCSKHTNIRSIFLPISVKPIFCLSRPDEDNPSKIHRFHSSKEIPPEASSSNASKIMSHSFALGSNTGATLDRAASVMTSALN